MNIQARCLIAFIAIMAACHRTADEFDDVPPQDELEDLRIDACEAVCSTMDRCDPNRFEGEDPPVCFDRCMTLMPRIYEENQCGSRELQWMFCVGELTCDQYVSWDLVTDHGDYHGPECAAEYGRATRCDEDEPFDMDEDNSQYP